AGQEKNLTSPEIANAAERLLEHHVIDRDAKGELQLPDDDYKRIAELYRLLFRSSCPLEVLGCRWYDDHINDRLVEEIRNVPHSLPLSEEDIRTTITLVRLSPHALGYALRPIDVIAGHRAGQQAAILPPEIDRMDRDYFMKVLCDSLQRDYTHPMLSEYFYDV